MSSALPTALLHALRGVDHDVLRARFADLSTRYREATFAEGDPALRDDLDCLAYAAVRMPATYQATESALRVAAHRVGRVSTHLDLGGGTGAAAWAAQSIWPTVRTEVLERVPAAIHLGRRLVKGSVVQAVWTAGDLRQWTGSGPVDLITAAYVLNELAADTRRTVLDLAAAAATAVVLVEPGTPRSHGVLLEARDRLIGHGFTIAAPCAHQLACPLSGPDWCHFAVRLPRTELHRRLKEATRNFEDEKFSYLVATRAPRRDAVARILRRPARPKGRVVLDLCTPDGAHQRSVIAKSAPGYRAARKVAWGDTWLE
ncbi:rRNA methyltransferase [Kribbella sandramycini]|uniref:Ribosomal protein RSM22 (Predicted rRNA methylase) n=1 Tax=Kribbella sandramycini TaxID=60450 RepID=A0A7Y4KYB7_9ACTN|nr:small ribosomal subunit Rsm22 family protein [Kribbella sandramycini]MBB6569256.1 ribosomal protein RSM22 (predicted rRNA methylase) [Kribbella sandramycini]NOL40903.1 rRNA methyltransferase [Kribbella sandramycini]